LSQTIQLAREYSWLDPTPTSTVRGTKNFLRGARVDNNETFAW
jgi:hypothetical protein